MKRYIKPEFTETTFLVNQSVSVSVCDPYEEAQPVDVKCAINSGRMENVFYEQCENNASTTGRLAYAQDYRDLNENGDKSEYIQYFVWTDGQHNGKPDQIGEKLIEELKVQSGSHAGYANPEILSIVNHS